MQRATGPGKIKEHAGQTYPALRASLYNFDFDDMHETQLKREHAKWLGENVATVLLQGSGWVWMQGSASKIGDPVYNKRLSQKRVERVAAFLRSLGVQDRQMQLNWVGEDLSTSELEDDERDRSVMVHCQPELPKPVEPSKPPLKPPKAPPVTESFKIRMLGGLNVSKFVDISKIKRVRDLLKWKVGPTVDILFFEIRDFNHGLSGFYAYVGGGAGIGGYWVSETHKGPPNHFMTSKPILVSQFAGAARFTTGGAGQHSMNFLHMMGTPKGVRNVYIDNFRTGTTKGIGLSTTVGYMGLLRVLPSTESW